MPKNSTEALARLLDGRADFAAVTLADLLPSPIASSGATVAVPVVGVAVAIAFWIVGEQQLTLDAGTLYEIFNGNITHWLDPRLVLLNSWMAGEPYASAIGDAEIQLIGTANSPTNDVLLRWLRRHGYPMAELGSLAPGRCSLLLDSDAEVNDASNFSPYAYRNITRSISPPPLWLSNIYIYIYIHTYIQTYIHIYI